MSNDEKKVDAYLDDIRSEFLKNKVTHPDKELSWGQFLDGTHTHGQTGLYGTVAAAIAFKSKSAQSPDGQSVENELVTYWSKKDSPNNHANLCQNIRLAALLLGLGFHSNRNSGAIVEISRELSARISCPDELWHDASVLPAQISPQLEFSSAIIIILVFATIQQYEGGANDFDNLENLVVQAAKALQTRYINDTKRDRPYLLAMLVAIVLVLGKDAHSAVQQRLSLCCSNSDSIFQRFWYHIDFGITLPAEGIRRDYFILPLRLLIPILILQKKIGGLHYLYASNVLTEIKKVFDSNDSHLFKESVERPSSLEQAIAVLALVASRKEEPRTYSQWLPKLWLAIKRPRKPEAIFAWILIIFGYIPIGIVVGAKGLLNITGIELWPSIHLLLEGAKLVPSWIPTALIMFYSALRKPNEMIMAAIGKGIHK